MQGFYFSVKFGLVIIHVLKAYRKKSSSILLREDILNLLLAFFSWNRCTFSILQDFSVENLETPPSTFLSKFFSELYLSRIINYWGSIFTLYLTWGALSLICILSVFSFFLSFFLSSLFYFSIGIFFDSH